MVAGALDDDFPLVRLNRVGIEMLTSMNGHIAVGALLGKYGDKICGPDGQPAPGIWNGGRSPIIRSAISGPNRREVIDTSQMGPPAATNPGKLVQQQEFEGEEHLKPSMSTN